MLKIAMEDDEENSNGIGDMTCEKENPAELIQPQHGVRLELNGSLKSLQSGDVFAFAHISSAQL